MFFRPDLDAPNFGNSGRNRFSHWSAPILPIPTALTDPTGLTATGVCVCGGGVQNASSSEFESAYVHLACGCVWKTCYSTKAFPWHMHTFECGLTRKTTTSIMVTESSLTTVILVIEYFSIQ